MLSLDRITIVLQKQQREQIVRPKKWQTRYSKKTSFLSTNTFRTFLLPIDRMRARHKDAKGKQYSYDDHYEDDGFMDSYDDSYTPSMGKQF